jgi:hypothetical protein
LIHTKCALLRQCLQLVETKKSRVSRGFNGAF